MNADDTPGKGGAMFPLWYIDKPDIVQGVSNWDVYESQGWISFDEAVLEMDVFGETGAGDPLIRLELYGRPELGTVLGLKHLHNTGFRGQCPFQSVAGNRYLVGRFRTASRSYEVILPVPLNRPNQLNEVKARKLQRLISRLRCPRCCRPKLRLMRPGDNLRCKRCATRYAVNPAHFDFLTDDFKREFNITPTGNVSSNQYDGLANNYIHKYRDGLILDCGAGKRDRYYENVVNYEIVAYESTDVLGVGERLPFLDDTFDVVFSVAVLEHVKDPSVCAREIVRVLKPGGVLYCEMPFLQPHHGYPHHYYNATQQGLLNLFGPQLEVQRLDVPNYGHPIALLNWFLNTYLAGLPEETCRQFGEMQIKQLLEPTSNYLGEPFVRQLDEQARTQLACCNRLLATKRG